MSGILQPDRIKIVELIKACSLDEIMEYIRTIDSYDELAKFIRRPVLAYEFIDIGDGEKTYRKISGPMPFDSYAEAEAARLQFIHDYCEPQKENFEL